MTSWLIGRTGKQTGQSHLARSRRPKARNSGRKWPQGSVLARRHALPLQAAHVRHPNRTASHRVPSHLKAASQRAHCSLRKFPERPACSRQTGPARRHFRPASATCPTDSWTQGSRSAHSALLHKRPFWFKIPDAQHARLTRAKWGGRAARRKANKCDGRRSSERPAQKWRALIDLAPGQPVCGLVFRPLWPARQSGAL